MERERTSGARRCDRHASAFNPIYLQTMANRPRGRPPKFIEWDVKKQQYVPVLTKGHSTLSFQPAPSPEVVAAEDEND